MKIDQRVAVLPHQCLCRFAVRMLDSSSVVTLRLPDNCGGSSMPPEVRAFGFDALAPLPAAAGALPLSPLLLLLLPAATVATLARASFTAAPAFVRECGAFVAL